MALSVTPQKKTKLVEKSGINKYLNHLLEMKASKFELIRIRSTNSVFKGIQIFRSQEKLQEMFLKNILYN